MVIYLKPEYEGQESATQSEQLKPKRKAGAAEKYRARIAELEVELADLSRELESQEADAEDARSELSGYREDAEVIEANWDFAQRELSEVLDNLKYRNRNYSMPELRELIEQILR